MSWNEKRGGGARRNLRVIPVDETKATSFGRMRCDAMPWNSLNRLTLLSIGQLRGTKAQEHRGARAVEGRAFRRILGVRGELEGAPSQLGLPLYGALYLKS